MKTIRNRPRTSSSVPRNSKPNTEYENVSSKNKYQIPNHYDENESDNSISKPKIIPSRNSQWRKLRPPNFKSYLKSESNPTETSKTFDNETSIKENNLKSENNKSISKMNSRSSQRRAQSLTRQKNIINDNDYSRNDKEYDYDFYFKTSERRKNSINFDEFKNPDGSPRKLSQKFKQLNSHSSKTNENASKPPLPKEDIFTPRKGNQLIRKKRSESVSNSIAYNKNVYSRNDELISTPKTVKYKNKSYVDDSNLKDTKSEQQVNSIEIALSRIQKELKEKDQSNNKKENKPAIKKKKRPFYEQIHQQQNQTTLNIPNYEPIENEQKNKSVIEDVKPHVQFMNSLKPPRRKEIVPTIVESNVEDAPKPFVEPTKLDFNKKIEFPPNYMKNFYSNYLNSLENE